MTTENSEEASNKRMKTDDEKKTFNVLILGASYGSLLASKLLLAGHNVTLVCRETTAHLINMEGTIVRIPIRGRDNPIEMHSRDLPGRLTASMPQHVDVNDYNLIVLAMQEPQYSDPGVRKLVQCIALSKIPTMAITNMPLLPFLQRIPRVNVDDDALMTCFTEPDLWKDFEPAKVTQCSPDPQAFRPPDEPANVLVVRLPTNFKAATFVNGEDTSMLRQLENDIQAAQFTVDGEEIQVPVKLKVYDSIFCPLAKWAMLLAGNYRCIPPFRQEMLSIQDAVGSNLEESRAIYDWVISVCIGLGGKQEDFVSFDKYAAAARCLSKPSSAARALQDGATNIERVDKLVALIAAQQGKQLAAVNVIVANVDEWLSQNNKKSSKS